MDCGATFPTPAMQFDHRDPSTKRHNVSKFATTGAIEGMLDEIEKCDLVCANCHAARTAEQRRLGLIRTGTPGKRQRRLDAASARQALSVAMPPIEPPAGYESLTLASRRYGVSERTLRRRIETGELDAERLMRPQGSILFVKIPEDAAPLAASDDTAVSAGIDEAGDRRQDAAVLTLLIEKMGEKDAALLAATERAVRAEGERDTARQTAEAAEKRAAEIQAELDRERNRSWWQRVWGIYPDHPST